MPAARKARVHMYNNYFSSRDNSYCSNARKDTELLSEYNFYEGVQNPCYGEKGSRVKVSGNIYRDCTGKADKGDAKIFTPPYAYKPDSTKKVPDMVRAGAGVR
jgi:pectate lyase